jgi:hypothetical protein
MVMNIQQIDSSQARIREIETNNAEDLAIEAARTESLIFRPGLTLPP